jgi:hypothetical protein
MAPETLAGYGLDAAEVLLLALLRCLATTTAADEEDRPGVEVLNDYRSKDATLARTAGALSYISNVSTTESLDDGFLPGVRRVRQQLEIAVQPGQRADSGRRVLLNLEYFTEEPWLGGDAWVPQGFVVDKHGLREPYTIEVAPVRRGGDLQVLLKYRDEAGVRSLVETVGGRLHREMESIFERAESYATARQFWLGEFGKESSGSSLDFMNEGRRTPGVRRTTVEREVSRLVLGRLTSVCGADAALVVLAAYGALLSRLNGREDVLLVSSRSREGRTELAPLKLIPSWGLSFREFVWEVGRVQTPAFSHAADAFDILAHDLPGSGAGDAGHVFDTGYIFVDAADANGDIFIGKAVEETCGRLSAAGHELDLALVFADHGGRQTLRFMYREGLSGPDVIDGLSAYLNSILAEVAANPDTQLGDIALGGKRTGRAASELLAKDVFNFGLPPQQ